MSSDSDSEVGQEPGGVAERGTASGSDSAASRKRQLSVPDMVRQVEQKRSGQQRVRQLVSPRGPGGLMPRPETQPVTLEALERLIEAGNGRVIAAIEARFAQFERRLDILETESFEKDLTIQRLQGEMTTLSKVNMEMKEQLEGIDMNRRLSSLILTCDDFRNRSQNEDMEMKVVQVLNKRLPKLDLAIGDIQVAHRLQSNNKVIVKFLKRCVREEVFERRFELFMSGGGRLRPDSGGGDDVDRRGMAPLYIAESLIPRMQQLYQTLLAARRQENGAKVASVFSRRGHVYCKTTKGGNNIRVRDEEHLRQLLGGAPPAPSRRPGGGEAAGDAAPLPSSERAGERNGLQVAPEDSAASADLRAEDTAVVATSPDPVAVTASHDSEVVGGKELVPRDSTLSVGGLRAECGVGGRGRAAGGAISAAWRVGSRAAPGW